MAEEIVRILKVDTKNSGKSIKELRNEIKALKNELEKATVGSEEFESTLKQLTQTQKTYNSVQQQIRDMSRTNQQDMVKLAGFAKNLAKSYSAVNAAIGLFSDGNEDIQRTMLKVQRTIQLIQGLSGIQGLVRDIPKVVNAFKGWLTSLNPIERKVDSIVKGINGISASKLKAINEANRAGGSTSTTSTTATVNAPQQINAQTQALQQQTRVITALNQARDQASAKVDALTKRQQLLQVILDKDKIKADALTQSFKQQGVSMSELTARLADQLSWREKAIIAQQKGDKTAATLLIHLDQEIKKTRDLIAVTEGLIAERDKAAAAANRTNLAIQKNEAELAKVNKQLTQYNALLDGTASKGAKAWNFTKSLFSTVGWTLLISVLITAVYKLWDYISGLQTAAKEQAKLNKEISEGTNQAAAKQIVVLKELSAAYQKLGDSAEKKKEFLQKYGDKIKETGISIDGLKKAEDVLVNNTDKYVNAIMARAKAQAIENVAVKIYQDYLNERYDLEQKFEKNKQRRSGADKQSYIDLLIASGSSAEEAEKAWAAATNKRQQKILDQIDAADKKTRERLKKMFEDIAQLEKEYAGMFETVTTSSSRSGGDSRDWAKEYKEALDALKKYVQDYLDIFKDARTKELDDNKRAYEQNIRDINENFLKGVQAAQGNAKKLLELEKEKDEALKLAQLAYERQRLEIIDKYNDEVYEKQKAEFDREYALLEKQIERNRKLNDTSNLREPAQYDYQTQYKQSKATSILGLGKDWINVYQTKENLDDQYEAQVEYNNQVLALTKARVENENKLLEEERKTLEEKANLLREQLNSTDINDLDKRRDLADQIMDIENTLFTNRQTVVENEIALDNAQRKNEEDNLQAFLERQEKRRTALNATLDVVSSATGAMANMFRLESQNDKKSEKQRQNALKAYKAFAITQAIADTYKGANEAYAAMASIPYVGPALGIAAAAAAIMMGIANVRSIMSESISTSNTTASVSAPAPVDTAPISYSRNLIGDKELDDLNQPIKCYVLESDITSKQNKVKVTENNATF